MQRSVPESEWKVFRTLRDAVRERFCERILEQIDGLCRAHGRSPYERYRDIFCLLNDRDREMAQAFDDVRRSTMIASLGAMVRLDLVGPRDLAQFTESTRETVGRIAGRTNRNDAV